MDKPKLIRQDLIYPELSYKIIGSAFDVHNEIGFGHHEKVYQKALAASFAKHGLNFKEQLYCPVLYDGKVVGRGFLDFLVENRAVVELKKNSRFSKSNIEQVNNYLKANKLKLAILINFSSNGVLFKRLVNLS